MSRIKGYIGTYASKDSLGIYEFTLEMATGDVSEPQLFFEAPNAKCSAWYKNLLAVPIERNGKAGVCLLSTDKTGASFLDEVLEERVTPCFAVQDETYIYTANYHEGFVMIYEKSDSKLRVVKRIETEDKAGCHQVLIHEHFLLVPCLELDCIRIFDREKDYELVGEIEFPKGSGPRHGVFNQQHSKLYVISEKSNELFVFHVKDSINFELVEHINLIPNSMKNGAAGAAIRLTKDERFLYTSIRGADKIIVVDVSNAASKIVQQASCEGKHPRDFILTPDENYIVIVNRSSNELVSLKRNAQTGEIGPIVSRKKVSEGVGITLETEF